MGREEKEEKYSERVVQQNGHWLHPPIHPQPPGEPLIKWVEVDAGGRRRLQQLQRWGRAVLQGKVLSQRRMNEVEHASKRRCITGIRQLQQHTPRHQPSVQLRRKRKERQSLSESNLQPRPSQSGDAVLVGSSSSAAASGGGSPWRRRRMTT